MRCEKEKKGGWLVGLAVRDDDEEDDRGKETVRQGHRRRGVKGELEKVRVDND